MLDTPPKRPGALAAAATVLLVEQDPVLRELLAVCLRDDGYAVVEAQDSAEAIRILVQHHTPDYHFGVVLLDGHPTDRGVRPVLQYLAGLGHPVPVVVIGADPLTLGTVASGEPIVLRQPIDWGQLRAVVVRCCESGGGRSAGRKWREEQEPDERGGG